METVETGRWGSVTLRKDPEVNGGLSLLVELFGRVEHCTEGWRAWVFLRTNSGGINKQRVGDV